MGIRDSYTKVGGFRALWLIRFDLVVGFVSFSSMNARIGLRMAMMMRRDCLASELWLTICGGNLPSHSTDLL